MHRIEQLNRRASRARVALAAACVMAVAGCSRRAEVGGVVSLDGKPLSSGVVTFSPTGDGPTGYAAIGSDGRYVVQVGSRNGLPPGEYVITVAANVAPAEGVSSAPGPYSDGITPLATPQKYSEREQSPLRATLISGSQTLPLDLSSQ
jgi:hypothetical protein